jgi:hypothetical protein
MTHVFTNNPLWTRHVLEDAVLGQEVPDILKDYNAAIFRVVQSKHVLVDHAIC